MLKESVQVVRGTEEGLRMQGTNGEMEERVIREGTVHREEVAIKGKNIKIVKLMRRHGKG